MYADDTTIYFNLEDFDNLTKETDINKELEKVHIWLKLNKLSLNTQKTKLMLFHRQGPHSFSFLELKTFLKTFFYNFNDLL